MQSSYSDATLTSTAADLSPKGRILEAVVLSTLFYGAEVRPFTAEEKRRYQVFINTIVAAAVWSVTDIPRTEMSGKYTFSDFAKWCDIKTVDECIFQRTALYLGHFERCPSDRVEKRMLSARIADFQPQRQRAT